jgi:flagellar basal-body rod protein FlgB
VEFTTMGLLDSVDRLHAGLDYHLARQNLLTANLTQVDTPNYRPVDLQRGADFKSALHVALESTNPEHFGGPTGGTGQKEVFRVVEDPGAAAGYDGNGVNVDREAAKIAANNVRYDALASLVTNELSGLEWAANDGK